MIIGAMISLQQALPNTPRGPLTRALIERASCFADAFRRIVFAQVRISALNTVLTAIYLALALPLFGIHLPLTKTLIAVTFIAGLLPVVGNLISNTIIVIVSLAHSSQTALFSLLFLVVVHKSDRTEAKKASRKQKGFPPGKPLSGAPSQTRTGTPFGGGF